MLTHSPVLPIGASTLARGLATLTEVVASVVKAFARARRNRREAMALAGLDRSMLKDIGITRSDLNDAFSTPFWQDPTALLHERAIERRMNRAIVRTASPPLAPEKPLYEPASHQAIWRSL